MIDTPLRVTEYANIR